MLWDTFLCFHSMLFCFFSSCSLRLLFYLAAGSVVPEAVRGAWLPGPAQLRLKRWVGTGYRFRGSGFSFFHRGIGVGGAWRMNHSGRIAFGRGMMGAKTLGPVAIDIFCLLYTEKKKNSMVLLRGKMDVYFSICIDH